MFFSVSFGRSFWSLISLCFRWCQWTRVSCTTLSMCFETVVRSAVTLALAVTLTHTPRRHMYTCKTFCKVRERERQSISLRSDAVQRPFGSLDSVLLIPYPSEGNCQYTLTHTFTIHPPIASSLSTIVHSPPGVGLLAPFLLCLCRKRKKREKEREKCTGVWEELLICLLSYRCCCPSNGALNSWRSSTHSSRSQSFFYCCSLAKACHDGAAWLAVCVCVSVLAVAVLATSSQKLENIRKERKKIKSDKGEKKKKRCDSDAAILLLWLILQHS